MRLAVLGGGPGGLLAALLAKRGDPGREVTVFERNRAGDTFGFGVVFSDATLDGIDAAEPVLRRALTEHGVHWDPIEVRPHQPHRQASVRRLLTRGPYTPRGYYRAPEQNARANWLGRSTA